MDVHQRERAENPLSGAKWIAGDEACESPVLTRRFQTHGVRQAVLSVTGLGYFEARVNGAAVTDERFIPVITDYEPRRTQAFLYPIYDTTAHRIYYGEYDVTALMREGENTLSIQLGNGFYRQKERTAEGKTDFGTRLKAIYCLRLEDAQGSCAVLLSDGSETWQRSEIVRSNLFLGETIDPRAADGREKPVTILEAPEAVLEKQIGTPDRVIRTLVPRLLGRRDGRSVYDAGENVSGVVRVRASGAQGDPIVLRFAENLHPDGTLDFASTGAHHRCAGGAEQIMSDTFVCTGESRAFEPRFVWHAFRYFDVLGDIQDAQVKVVHSDTPVTARFESASEGLNFLYDAFVRTQLNNMHGSIPSDCPHRERLGYTGDGQVCAPAAMMILDSRAFYRKWIVDILDCQGRESGHVQHTAPFMGGGGGPGGWGCAIVLTPYAYYRRYGDTDVLRRCYEPMKRWIGYLRSRCEEGLVVREEEGGWCLGDWCTLEKTVLRAPYLNSCYLLKSLQILGEIARVLEKPGEAGAFEALEKETAEAIRRAYADEQGVWAGGVQGAEAYAVWAGLAGAEAAGRLNAYYDRLGHFDTGFLATDLLLEALFRYGYADTAFKLLSSEAPGSFLYMKRHGATTIWETWDGRASHDHPMFGACVRQLFESILGVRQEPGTAGYRSVRIAPCIPQGLPFASGGLDTPGGRVEVAFEREADGVRFEIAIAKDVRAVFEWKGEKRPLHAGRQTFVCKP